MRLPKRQKDIGQLIVRNIGRSNYRISIKYFPTRAFHVFMNQDHLLSSQDKMRAICGDLSPTTEFSEFFYSPKVIKYRKCVTCLFAKPRCSQFTSPLNRSFINKRYSTESDWVVID